MKRPVACIFITAVTLMAASCGGTTSDKQSPRGAVPVQQVSSDSPTRASGFFAQADAICERTKSQLAASLQALIKVIKEHTLPAKQASERQHAVEEAAQSQGIQQLASLKPPPRLVTAYRNYLAMQKQRLTLAPWRAKSPSERRSVIKQREEVDRDGIAMAKQIGFKTCT